MCDTGCRTGMGLCTTAEDTSALGEGGARDVAARTHTRATHTRNRQVTLAHCAGLAATCAWFVWQGLHSDTARAAWRNHTWWSPSHSPAPAPYPPALLFVLTRPAAGGAWLWCMVACASYAPPCTPRHTKHGMSAQPPTALAHAHAALAQYGTPAYQARRSHTRHAHIQYMCPSAGLRRQPPHPRS